MGRISQSFYAGLGAAGAMVDIAGYVNELTGISRSYGTKSEFDQVAPGTFSFTLDNGDGRFTPDNTATYPTPLTEGMTVAWDLGGQLRSGKILSIAPGFPSAESAWAEVQVTVHDALGLAARLDLTGSSLINSMILGSPAYLWFPMDDAPGSLYARDATGGNVAPLPTLTVLNPGGSSTLPTFGAAGVPAIAPVTQVEMSGTQSGFGTFPLGAGRDRYNVSYPPGSVGAWGFWFTPMGASADFTFSWVDGQFGDTYTFRCTTLANGMRFSLPGAIFTAASSALAVGEAHYFSVVITPGTSLSAALYMDGVLQGTSTGTRSGGQTDLGPRYINLTNNGANPARMQNLTHTAGLINEYATTQIGTEAGWLTTLGLMSADVKLATLPAGLSDRPIGPVTYQNRALLDLIAEVVYTEQGYLYTTTTGTITAPVQRVVVRDRSRPAGVSYTFDAQRDLQGAPEFVRDITNMVSSVDVTGPVTEVRAADANIAKRVGSANTSETIISSTDIDLLAWGQDRLNRGANVRLRIASLTIDAMTLPTGTAAATIASLLAMVPGDRVQITNLPNTQLAFSTWDGWFLGAEELHSTTEHTFTLYFQPTLPDTAIYDTNLWMSGGIHSLSAGITNVATTMSVATADPITVLETTTFPYTMTIDNEQVTVTACTSATPQVATITRGVNGTSPAAHSSGALVEITPASLYAF